MTDTPAARAIALRRELEAASHAYYVLDRPTLSDAEYDRLFRALQAIERDHPVLLGRDRHGLDAVKQTGTGLLEC